MLKKISSSKINSHGIYIGQLFVGCICYANDTALLSASCYGLQQELSYRIQIARQLRTQFVESISMTLSVIREVTTWIFSWSSLNYKVGQLVTGTLLLLLQSRHSTNEMLPEAQGRKYL